MFRIWRKQNGRDQTHPVDEIPPAWRMLTIGIQHVLAMYAGAVAVPLIIGGAVGLPRQDIGYLINADLLVAGAGTLLQCVGIWRFGARMPLVQGCAFVAVAPMVDIGRVGGGLPAIYGAVIAAGLAMVVLAPIYGRLLRFFPPLVIGTVITIVGLSLLPVAANWTAGGANAPNFGDPRNLGLAAGVLAFIILVHRFAPPAMTQVSVLLGIAVGTLVSIPTGFTDFTGVSDAGLVGVSMPFHFGLPTFDLVATSSLLVVAFVTMTETTGDILAVGELVGLEVDRRRLSDGLRADGISTLLGGVFNTFPYTAYAQNVGLIGLTKVHSRFVVATAGGILVALGLVPALGAIVASVPLPVLGGAGMALFGMVAAAGIRLLARAATDDNASRLVIACALAVGLLPVGAPHIYDRLPDWIQAIARSGISLGCLTAVVLNALLVRVPASTGRD